MALEIFGDFGFVGGANPSSASDQDNQSCINWYVEVSSSPGSKTPAALLGCPGLTQIAAAAGGGAPGFSNTMTAWPQPSSVTNLPVRGMWVLPGWQTALVVISDTVYLAIAISQGSTNTPGAISLQSVGTLSTSSGVVNIRDNGAGGYAVIVDGNYGYLYQIATQTLTQITDPNFLGTPLQVAYIDGWWIFNQGGTPIFYTDQSPYSTTWNASYFALKDAASDNLVGLIENKEELWLIGERTSEIWYNAGGQYFPFQRLVGTMLQIGCKATYSIARLNAGGQEGLIWFGRSERGENVVVRTSGLQAQVVSTPAVSDALAKLAVTSDAIGFTYEEDAHEFYVLTFPTSDVTWVYDATLPPQYAWHQRLSYDPYAQSYHRHRSNCFMNFAGMRIVGDYQNGALYQYTRAAYTDAGWPILARRRAPHIWSKEDRRRVFMASLQVDFRAGVGNASGMGSNPVASLRISKDGGQTYGQRWIQALGAIGETLTRVLWRRLSWGRDNVVELEVIDPVNRDIVGTTLRAQSEPG